MASDDGADEIDAKSLTGRFRIIPVGKSGADDSKGRDATLIRGKEVRLGDDSGKRRG
jgi:hypothetical protein